MWATGHCKDFGFYSGQHEEPVEDFEQRRDLIHLLWLLQTDYRGKKEDVGQMVSRGNGDKWSDFR